MKQLTTSEFGRIARATIGSKGLNELQRLDEERDDPVFDWGRKHHVYVRGWVGVLQTPSVTIEIVPKIDEDDGASRANLAFMLSYCGLLPARPRDLAGLETGRNLLSEVFIAVFAERLLVELRRGLHREYVRHEANSAFFRGKLIVAEHVRRNTVRSDRVFVAYDDLIEDTMLSRILKAATSVLLERSRVARTRQRLVEALERMADVADAEIDKSAFAAVQFTRNSERFRDLVEFCKLVLFELTPLTRMGSLRTFTLLFPMDVVFERFVARFLRRHAEEIGISRAAVHVQARAHRRWLMRRDGRGHFRLKPDILVQDEGAPVRLIIDTKWKRLVPDAQDERNGVVQSDAYQLFAYAQCYDCRDNVMLFPRMAGVTPKTYAFDESRRKLRVEMLDVSQMRSNRSSLIAQLRRICVPEQA